jgi:hypothetical protein
VRGRLRWPAGPPGLIAAQAHGATFAHRLRDHHDGDDFFFSCLVNPLLA